MRRKCWKAWDWSWWNGDKWIWNRVSKVGFAHSRIKNYLATVTITILSYQKLWDWRRRAPLTFCLWPADNMGIGCSRLSWHHHLYSSRQQRDGVCYGVTRTGSDSRWRIHSPPHPNSMNQELLHARWRVNLCWENITRRSEASLPGVLTQYPPLS